MNIPFIIVIRNRVVDSVKQTTKENCERDFLDACQTNLSNWDKYDQYDRDVLLENGYAHFGKGTVCITWVDVDLSQTEAHPFVKEICAELDNSVKVG
jgi:hypothetical protein